LSKIQSFFRVSLTVGLRPGKGRAKFYERLIGNADTRYKEHLDNL